MVCSKKLKRVNKFVFVRVECTHALQVQVASCVNFESNCFGFIYIQHHRPSFYMSPIAIDKVTVRNSEGDRSHVLFFCVNLEWHISIITSIKCYFHFLRCIHVPFTNI